MAVLPSFDLARDYLSWLRNRIVKVDRGQTQVLVTPFLDSFNDGIQIYVEPRGAELLLHDNGHTVDNLLDLGLRIEDSERRNSLIQRAMAGLGVRYAGDRLEIVATSVNLAQRAHFLLTAVVRLNDLWMSATPHRLSDFFEIVREFLDQHEVLYTVNVSIPGRTVEHAIDFVIPLPKRHERLVKLIGAPTPQTAKVISFTWLDLQDSRPDAERVVVLNDIYVPDPFAGESEEAMRQVSEQTMAILTGYSTSVYRWSDRDKPDFSNLYSIN